MTPHWQLRTLVGVQSPLALAWNVREKAAESREAHEESTRDEQGQRVAARSLAQQHDGLEVTEERDELKAQRRSFERWEENLFHAKLLFDEDFRLIRAWSRC